jgi:hypothetical protein
MMKYPTDFLLNELLSLLEDYQKESQRLSFGSSKQEVSQLNEFSSTCLEHLSSLIRGEPYTPWGWGVYKGLRERGRVEVSKDLVEYIIFNLGDHEASAFNGEKWTHKEGAGGVLFFEPVSKPSIKMSQLLDLKEQHPSVVEVCFDGNTLRVELGGKDER